MIVTYCYPFIEINEKLARSMDFRSDEYEHHKHSTQSVFVCFMWYRNLFHVVSILLKLAGPLFVCLSVCVSVCPITPPRPLGGFTSFLA